MADERRIKDVLDVIRKSELVDTAILDAVISEAEQNGAKPVELLVRRNLITKNQLTGCIAETLGLRYVDLSEFNIPREATRLIPSEFAKYNQVVPLGADKERNLAVVAVPLRLGNNLELNDRIRQMSEMSTVEFVISPAEQITEAIKDLYRVDEELERLARDASKNSAEEAANSPVISDSVDESSAQRFVRLALQQGVEDGASDIIFEAHEDGLLLRYRIDGRWYERSKTPLGMADEVVSVVKILSNLDITNRKRGQDGRMFMDYNGNKIDFRVNVFPIQDGENVTLRILDNTQANRKLDELGFSETNLERFMSAIRKPQGLILVTGPTGSGKSVTLYAGLNVIASPAKNTYTIEDPIEYRIEHVKQSQIDVKAGWTYPRAIESFMRAAPDNILVGEIRNLETAHMALEAGLTGHLVLSTLHTNSAAEAAARLIDMGAEQDIVSMTLTAVVAQRLVRKLCDRCKIAEKPNPEELKRVNFPWNPSDPLPTLYKPGAAGCKECKGLGFKGRTAAHEVMLINSDIKSLILARSSAHAIEAAAVENGMTPILQDGFAKVLQGTTTIPEVLMSITTSS